MTELKAPFPWFGGKSRVAHLVWERFGAVANYVEPFAGSLAVLLARPHEARTETVEGVILMTTDERDSLYEALDAVADTLRVARLEDVAKSEYFYSLRGYSLPQIVKALAWLRDNHQPFGRHDFPVPSEIRAAMDTTRDNNYTGKSRSYPEVVADFERRGIRIYPQGATPEEAKGDQS